MISGFETNSLGSREVELLHLVESGGKALSGKGSSLELRPRLEGGSKDLSDISLHPACPELPVPSVSKSSFSSTRLALGIRAVIPSPIGRPLCLLMGVPFFTPLFLPPLQICPEPSLLILPVTPLLLPKTSLPLPETPLPEAPLLLPETPCLFCPRTPLLFCPRTPLLFCPGTPLLFSCWRLPHSKSKRIKFQPLFSSSPIKSPYMYALPGKYPIST